MNNRNVEDKKDVAQERTKEGEDKKPGKMKELLKKLVKPTSEKIIILTTSAVLAAGAAGCGSAREGQQDANEEEMSDVNEESDAGEVTEMEEVTEDAGEERVDAVQEDAKEDEVAEVVEEDAEEKDAEEDAPADAIPDVEEDVADVVEEEVIVECEPEDVEVGANLHKGRTQVIGGVGVRFERKKEVEDPELQIGIYTVLCGTVEVGTVEIERENPGTVPDSRRYGFDITITPGFVGEAYSTAAVDVTPR